MLGAPMAIANSRLRPWQVGILILPIAGVISFCWWRPVGKLMLGI
ncbi:hypothetical protein NON20_07515 [Synechocystis sp. B12]|nr:hypothetical protein NON20_07515 [Synechocystis sp. B12]